MVLRRISVSKAASLLFVSILASPPAVAQPLPWTTDASSGAMAAAVQVFAGMGLDVPLAHFRAAFVDLNGDGTQELLVSMTDATWCGNRGCALNLYQRSTLGWRSMNQWLGFGIERAPTSTGGWNDLLLETASGGPSRWVYQMGLYAPATPAPTTQR